MRRLAFALFFIAIIAGATWRWRAEAQPAWTAIAPGIEMRTFTTGPGGASLIALRSTAKHVHVATGDLLEAPGWRRRENAVVAVNGGFFDEAGHSLGVRVANGRQVSRAHGSKWGVFYVADETAHIVAGHDFQFDDTVREAVQCGPRLVVHGRVQTVKEQWARRSGIGVQRDGRVIIAISDGEMSLPVWAHLWASRDGLACEEALNLDGGSSTQLSLQAGSHTLEIAGGRTVSDAVVIR